MYRCDWPISKCKSYRGDTGHVQFIKFTDHHLAKKYRKKERCIIMVDYGQRLKLPPSKVLTPGNNFKIHGHHFMRSLPIIPRNSKNIV